MTVSYANRGVKPAAPVAGVEENRELDWAFVLAWIDERFDDKEIRMVAPAPKADRRYFVEVGGEYGEGRQRAHVGPTGTCVNGLRGYFSGCTSRTTLAVFGSRPAPYVFG